MRDLNPLYGAVIQAVETMASGLQAAQPQLRVRTLQPPTLTAAQVRLNRLLNGDVESLDDMTASKPVAAPADEQP